MNSMNRDKDGKVFQRIGFYGNVRDLLWSLSILNTSYELYLDPLGQLMMWSSDFDFDMDK